VADEEEDQFPRRVAGEALGIDASGAAADAALDLHAFRCHSRAGRRRRLLSNPTAMIEAIISDFGGVLTSPLLDSFLAFEQASASRRRRSVRR